MKYVWFGLRLLLPIATIVLVVLDAAHRRCAKPAAGRRFAVPGPEHLPESVFPAQEPERRRKGCLIS